jgi:hypothetical protein
MPNKDFQTTKAEENYQLAGIDNLKLSGYVLSQEPGQRILINLVFHLLSAIYYQLRNIETEIHNLRGVIAQK